MPYNGHKNWNCWNVSLWLHNDEGLYRLMIDCVRQARTKAEAATTMLEYLPAKTPDGAPYTKTSVSLAMKEVE